MKIYRIFLKKSKEGIIKDLELLKEGFNFWAFLFNIFLFLYKKLWIQSLIFIAIFTILTFLQIKFLSYYITFSIKFCLAIYIAFDYIDWKSKKLIKNKYDFLGYSSGNDPKEAKLKFLDGLNNSYSSGDKLEQKIF